MGQKANFCRSSARNSYRECGLNKDLLSLDPDGVQKKKKSCLVISILYSSELRLLFRSTNRLTGGYVGVLFLFVQASLRLEWCGMCGEVPKIESSV